MNDASAFDQHHPPAPELINQCVHCGFCLPACPTYVLWGQEMDSPRGRIYLMKTASEGSTAITPQWVQHFDSCLGCMSCMTACPSGVDYGKLIEATRTQIERHHERSTAERLHRKMIFALFPNVARLRLLRPLLKLYQRSGLQGLVRGMGILKILPKQIETMEGLLPRLGAHHEIPTVTPAQGTRRKRVGLLLGCVQREFLSHINAATVRVLAAEGCEVIAPGEQTCCGALLVHAGEEAPALDLAKKVIDVFERANVEIIITNAGGPGILCADACEARGLEIPVLSEHSREALKSLLPPGASAANPVDMIASASAEQYRETIRIVAADDNVDALIIIFTPPLVMRAEDVADCAVFCINTPSHVIMEEMLVRPR